MQTMLTKKKIVGLALLCCAAVTIAIVLTFVLNSTAKAEEPPRYSASPVDVYTLSVQQPASVYQQEYQDQVASELENQLDSGAFTAENPLVALNPFGTNTLSVYVAFDTEQPASVSYRVWTTDNTIPQFQRTLTNDGENGVTTRHAYQMIGLIPDCANTIELTLTGQDGTVLATTAFEVTAPKLKSGMDVQLKKKDHSDGELSDGLYVTMGANADSDSYQYAALYDNDGFIRGEIPLDNYRPDRLNFTQDGQMVVPVDEDQIVWLNRQGKMEKTVTIAGYTMHHDLIIQEDGDLLVLANKTSKDTEEDIVLEVNASTGAVTELLDLETLYPEYVKACSTEKEKLDWFHANAITLAGEDSVLLSSRETSSIVKIKNLHTKPEIDYMIGDESIWEGFSYQSLLLQKDGEFTSQAGQHSVVYQPDDSLPEGQYYVYCYNNNYGSMVTRESYDWSNIPGVGDYKNGDASKIYKFLVDENTRSYSLVFEKDVTYSSVVSSAQQMDNGNYLSCSGNAKEFQECDENGETITTFHMNVDAIFIYRVYKYDFSGYWF